MENIKEKFNKAYAEFIENAKKNKLGYDLFEMTNRATKYAMDKCGLKYTNS